MDVPTTNYQGLFQSMLHGKVGKYDIIKDKIYPFLDTDAYLRIPSPAWGGMGGDEGPPCPTPRTRPLNTIPCSRRGHATSHARWESDQGRLRSTAHSG